MAPVEETDKRGRKRRTTRNKDTGRGTPQGAPISPPGDLAYASFSLLLRWDVRLDRMTDITEIFLRIEQGDSSASDQLLPVVYDELRRLASQLLSQENPGR